MNVALARLLAWALLMSSWLALGSTGRDAWPLYVGGLLPVAAWLVAIGLLLSMTQSRRFAPRFVQAVLLCAAPLAALALFITPEWPGMAFAAALAGAAVVVAASRAVRSLRRPSMPTPLIPAAVGTAIAWLGAATPRAAALTMLACAIALAHLARRGTPARGCRSGLFDCALPLALPSTGGRRPETLARWMMLPMMATLGAMSDWCSASLDVGARASVGLHLAAMFGPPVALHLAGVRTVARSLVPALLLAAVVLGWLVPGLRGTLAGSLGLALAWGLAWAEALGRPSSPECAPTPPAFALPAMVVLATGWAVDLAGPMALGGLLMIGCLALTGAAAWKHLRSLCRDPRVVAAHAGDGVPGAELASGRRRAP